jgi:DNA (cytosine-5)-methyltransferase 1
MTPFKDKTKNRPRNIRLIVIDLFCGAGGTTSGFEEVEEAEVIACVNHDENAIMSHAANHPYAEHFIEDITEMYGMVRNGILFKSPQLMRMIRLVELYRAFYPEAKLVIWASLECTNFSKAKGGGSRDADSRTLANHMDRYYVPLDADYLMFENVVEFMSWGPLTARVSKLPKEEGGYKYCEIRYEPVYDDALAGSDYDENPNEETERVQIGWRVNYDAVPNTSKNGSDFMRWTEHIKSLGYQDNGGNGWKELNSADFGAYTSRNRLFGIFAKKGLPIAWPEATHEKVKTSKKKGAPSQMPQLFTSNIVRAPWKPVKDVLDFSNEGNSIFNRKKPLSDKTLERIYAGLLKFVAGGKDNFLAKIYAVASNSTGVYSTDSVAHTLTTRDAHAIVKPIFITKYYSGKPDGKNITLEGPAGTITTVDGQALVHAAFLAQRNGGDPEGRVVDVNGPARTLTSTAGNQDLVTADFLSTYNGENPEQRVHDLGQPAGTLTTTNTHSLIRAFIQKYHGTGDNVHSVDAPAPTLATKDQIGLMNIEYLLNYHGNSDANSVEEPSPTLTTKDKIAKVHPCFIMRDFTGGGQVASVDQPAGTVMPSPKLNLVTPFIMPTNYDNEPTSIDDVLSTITANRKWHYIVNPSHGGNCTATDVPGPVVVARQDKAPLSLTVVDSVSGDHMGIAVRIDAEDSDIMIRIKIFMVLYDIVDIKMRMLMISELLKIQGFRENYVLIGTQADKKKFIGNAVHPLVPEHMAKALLRKLDEHSPHPIKLAA